VEVTTNSLKFRNYYGRPCKARLQSHDWDCGPATLDFVRKLYGRPSRALKKALKEANPSPERGTNQAGMIRGLQAMRLIASPFPFASQKEFWNASVKVAPGAPMLLCLDDNEHWVICLGGVKNRLSLFDPEKGFVAITRKDLKKRWKKTPGAQNFIAIIITDHTENT
jgi:ABC-type bacteriocin/lantibiotic exporter with double-glycine peptidase domain